MATQQHTRNIACTNPDERDAEDREYAVSCSCDTVYVSRLRSHAAATQVMTAHLAAVLDGSWASEQRGIALALAAAAPFNAALKRSLDARDAVRSAGFGVIVAQQHGTPETLAEAKQDLVEARAEQDAAHLVLERYTS